MRQRAVIHCGHLWFSRHWPATAGAFDVFPVLKDINSNLYTDTRGRS